MSCNKIYILIKHLLKKPVFMECLYARTCSFFTSFKNINTYETLFLLPLRLLFM